MGDEVEELFTKHFAKEDRTKAMKYLKPRQRTDSHGKTFFIGNFPDLFLLAPNLITYYNDIFFAVVNGDFFSNLFEGKAGNRAPSGY